MPATLPPRITPDEFRDRQRRARELAAQRGLAGILVWSRGGHTTDRFYDVQWLAGYTSQFPFIPDGPGWSARSHAALILPVDGPTVLVADMPAFRDDLAVADRIEQADDVSAATAAVLAGAIPAGTIGVLGADTLAYPWHAAIERATGSGRLERHDDLGWRLRLVKSPAEQELLRAASAIGSRAVTAVMEACAPGATEAEAAAAGIAIVVAAGAMLHGISISSGPYAHHYAQSQPAPYDARRDLQAGDLARVDLYGSVDGYLFDFGRSRVVGRAPDDGQAALLEAVRETTLAGPRGRSPRRHGRRRRARLRGALGRDEPGAARAGGADRLRRLGPLHQPLLGGAVDHRRQRRGAGARACACASRSASRCPGWAARTSRRRCW